MIFPKPAAVQTPEAAPQGAAGQVEKPQQQRGTDPSGSIIVDFGDSPLQR